MREIYIRKMRYNEAREKLEKELNEAFLKSESMVTVIHGIGEGKLKKLTEDFVNDSGIYKLLESPDFIKQNYGETKVEILAPDKKEIKRWMK